MNAGQSRLRVAHQRIVRRSSRWEEPRIAYKHKSHTLTVQYYVQVLKWVGNLPRKGIVVDIGCGRGYMVKQFNEIGLDAIGLDVSEEMAKEAKKKGLEVIMANAEHLPFRQSACDVTICFEVLEHLPKPVLAFSEVHRVLKKGGMFIATIPLKHLMTAILDLLRGEKTHITMLTAREWLEMARRFFDISYRTLFILPVPPVLFGRYFKASLGLFDTVMWLCGLKGGNLS